MSGSSSEDIPSTSAGNKVNKIAVDQSSIKGDIIIGNKSTVHQGDVHHHYPQQQQQQKLHQPTEQQPSSIQRFSSAKYHLYYFSAFMLLSTLKSEVKKHVKEVAGKLTLPIDLDISLNPVGLELSEKNKNADELDAEGHYNRRKDFEKISKPPKGDLTLNTLFRKQYHRNVIVLLGQAGSGKTSLAKLIANSALEKDILPTCKFVFFIQFREIDFSKKSYFFEFILERCSCEWSKTVESYKVLFKKLKDIPKILFIFDGLDEANTDELSKHNTERDVTIPQTPDIFIRKLLSGELFPKAIKLVTSRPRQFYELHKSHRPESVVNILGISKESQNDICQQICGDGSPQVKKYLDDHPYISASCYVPATCIITIAIIFENIRHKTMDKGEIAIHSLTDVFVEAFGHYTRSDHVDRTGRLISLSEMTREIWKLALLAWRGFVNRKLIFDEKDIKEVGIHIDAFEAFLRTSTVKSLKFAILDGDKKSTFSHLIWQELFSSVYIMMIAPAQKLQSHLSDLKSSQWEVVTRFMYGLCNKQIMKKMKIIFDSITFCDWDQKRNILKQFLLKSMQDIKEATSYNFAELIQLCSWLQEMNDDDFTRDVNLPETIVVDGNINPVDVFDLTYILKLSRKVVIAEFGNQVKFTNDALYRLLKGFSTINVNPAKKWNDKIVLEIQRLAVTSLAKKYQAECSFLLICNWLQNKKDDDLTKVVISILPGNVSIEGNITAADIWPLIYFFEKSQRNFETKIVDETSSRNEKSLLQLFLQIFAAKINQFYSNRKSLSDIVTGKSRVEEVDMKTGRYIPGVFEEDLAVLSHLIGKLPYKMRVLDLCGKRIDQKGASDIASCLHNIEELDVSWCRITDVEIIAKEISSLSHPMKKLNLSWNHIGRNGASDIASCLHNIEELDVRDCDITDVEVIAKKISSLSHPMKKLNLHWNHICQKGASDIASCLHNIEELDVSWCRITDVEVISKKILSLSHPMKKLNLHGNRIGQKGASDIAFCLHNIKELDVTGCGITDVEVIINKILSLSHPRPRVSGLHSQR